MSKRIVRYERNTKGRDIVVGDIHGYFSRLQGELDAIGFDPESDRLFSVGDLVDRGPESEKALDWLAKPWFHPVRGNHDDYVARHQTCDHYNWIANGGAWFQGLPSDLQAEMGVQFDELPIAIEIETAHGLIGIVHAECPFPEWRSLADELGSERESASAKKVRMACMWSRGKITARDESRVEGVLAVIVGHTPLHEAAGLGNTIYIDTMGWRDTGHFTLMDIGFIREGWAS